MSTELQNLNWEAKLTEWLAGCSLVPEIRLQWGPERKWLIVLLRCVLPADRLVYKQVQYAAEWADTLGDSLPLRECVRYVSIAVNANAMTASITVGPWPQT